MTRYSQVFKDQAVKLSDYFGLKKAAEQLGIFTKHACVLSRLRVVTLACCHACVLATKKEENT